MHMINSFPETKSILFLTILIGSVFLTSCNRNGPPEPEIGEIEYVGPPSLEREAASEAVDLTWYGNLKPDLVPVGLKVCRFPTGQYVQWEVLVTTRNQGGVEGLDVQEAPVDIYVDFDPNRPYGVDNATGEPIMLSESPNLLMDMPDQQYMAVPGGGEFGGVLYNLQYPDGGPGSRYRRIPTSFTVFLDQMRGGARGWVEEIDEFNNGVGVLIDRYDEISGNTGTYLIHCWYSE